MARAEEAKLDPWSSSNTGAGKSGSMTKANNGLLGALVARGEEANPAHLLGRIGFREIEEMSNWLKFGELELISRWCFDEIAGHCCCRPNCRGIGVSYRFVV